MMMIDNDDDDMIDVDDVDVDDVVDDDDDDDEYNSRLPLDRIFLHSNFYMISRTCFMFVI